MGVGLPAFVDDNKILSSLPAPSEEKGYLEDKKNRMVEALWDKNNRSGGTKMKSNASNLQNEKRT